MKQYLAIPVLAFTLCLMGCSNSNTKKDPMPNKTAPYTIIQNIGLEEPKEFKKRVESNDYIIIDLRTPDELLPENGGKAFENAINIDFYATDFKVQIEALDPSKSYLTYCRSGGRSGLALKLFKEKGFAEVIDLDGGKIAWDSFVGNK